MQGGSDAPRAWRSEKSKQRPPRDVPPWGVSRYSSRTTTQDSMQTQRRCTEVRRICEWLSPLLTLDRAKRRFPLPMTHAYPRLQLFLPRLLLLAKMYVRYHHLPNTIMFSRERRTLIANPHWLNGKDPPPQSLTLQKFLRVVHILRRNFLGSGFSSKPLEEADSMAGKMWDRPKLSGQQFGTTCIGFFFFGFFCCIDFGTKHEMVVS